MKSLILILMTICCSVFSQITITNIDIVNQFNIGNTVTVNEFEGNANINIGFTGGGNNWDFSTLQGNQIFILTCIDPSTTSFISDFPLASISTLTTGDLKEDPGSVWHFANVNGSYSNLGSVIISDSQPGIITMIKHNPGRHELMLPLTYNTNWTHLYNETVYVDGNPVLTYDVSLCYIVDAYGIMTIPGGFSFEALRLRESMTIQGTTHVSYFFITKSGARVSLFTDIASPPTSGSIDVVGFSYNNALVTSGIEQIEYHSTAYSISQNYPNPFSSSTEIEYSVPIQSHVTLNVYDILGNLVETLVDKEQEMGKYKIDYSPHNLMKGIYFYSIKTGNYNQTKKMIIL